MGGAARLLPGSGPGPSCPQASGDQIAMPGGTQTKEMVELRWSFLLLLFDMYVGHDYFLCSLYLLHMPVCIVMVRPFP